MALVASPKLFTGVPPSHRLAHVVPEQKSKPKTQKKTCFVGAAEEFQLVRPYQNMWLIFFEAHPHGSL